MEHVAIIDAHLLERRRAGRVVPWRQSRRARATAQMAAGAVFVQAGDARSSDAAFAKALLYDREIVRHPPPNLATYPQLYPAWLTAKVSNC